MYTHLVLCQTRRTPLKNWLNGQNDAKGTDVYTCVTPTISTIFTTINTCPTAYFPLTLRHKISISDTYIQLLLMSPFYLKFFTKLKVQMPRWHYRAAVVEISAKGRDTLSVSDEDRTHTLCLIQANHSSQSATMPHCAHVQECVVEGRYDKCTLNNWRVWCDNIYANQNKKSWNHGTE